MNKIFTPIIKFTIIALIISIKCFSQKTVNYKIDEVISIDLPENYSIKDTLDTKRVIAKGVNGNVVITKIIKEQIEANVYDDEQLAEYYKGFQVGFRKGCNGKLISEKIITIDNIKISKSIFSIQTTKAENYAIYLKDHVYSISFLCPFESEAEFETEKLQLLSSLKFAKGLTKEDQYNSHDEGSTAYKLGELVGRFLVIPIIALIVFLIVKKTRKKTF